MAARAAAALGMVAGIAITVAGVRSFAGRSATFEEVMVFLAGIAIFGISLFLSGQLRGESIVDIDAPAAGTPLAERPFLGPVALAVAGLGVVFGLLAFTLSGDGVFERNNSFFWLAGMALFLGGLLEFGGRPGLAGLNAWRKELRRPRFDDPSRWWPALALLAIVALAAFLRLYRLDSTPLEMMSDHAEKALDIQTVLSGKFPIYFDRNTGREPFHMYVAAGLTKVGVTDFSFMAIKLATVLPSILMVPATYMMTREFFGNRKIALLAAVFTAIAFWPIATGRVGLRFAYGQLFVALTLAFLLRSVKYRQRNDFLLCGLVLGFGMYSYMAFRVMPLVVGACLLLVIGVDLVQRRGRPDMRFVGDTMVLGLMALLAYAPLLRYAVTFREQYWFRIQSRGGATEADVSSPVSTFFHNLSDGFLMFNWKGDVVWVLNVPLRPGLDYVMGALMVLGVLILLMRWLKHRDVASVFFGVAFLALMMPTVLSLAFPAENPAFGRASGLIPLVFALVALPVYFAGAAVHRLLPERWGAAVVVPVAVGLVAWVGVMNFQDYFDEYDEVYKGSAHNATEIAAPMLAFAEAGPGIENAYIVVYPFWVDTRLLALELGDFGWNNVVLEIETAAAQLDDPSPKLYVLNQKDIAAMAWLIEAYPRGLLRERKSAVNDTKDFALFFTSPPGVTRPAGAP